MAFDLSSFQVGDEFEGSPSYLGKVISAILAEGGTLDYEGSSVVVTSLPNRKAKPVSRGTADTESVTPSVPDPEAVAPSVPEPEAESIPEPESESAPEASPKTPVAEKPKTVARKARRSY